VYNAGVREPKAGIRTIGVDDGPFDRSRRGDVLVAGAVYRGGDVFDGLLTTRVRKDGWNATDRLVAMLAGSKFLPQLHYLMLDGIALGGFNIVDLHRLHRETGLKALAVMRRRPDLAAVRRALRHVSHPDRRWRMLDAAGEILPIGGLCCQLAGLDAAEAARLLALTCTRSLVPEPLRAAHLIAGGLVTGQSGRRA
jgi:endonuclease V-like protein UPF0215 family